MSEPTTAAFVRHPLTDEQVRILRAIAEGRMTTNSVGRYVIDGEDRPDRKSRERLRGRGLIDHFYEQGRGSHWRVTARGKAVLDGLAAADAACVAEWVTLEDVAGIIRAAAQGAEDKGGLTECSAVALNSWAEVIERNLPLAFVSTCTGSR